MSTMRIPERVYASAHEHLFGRPGEHFAFLLARWTYSSDEPIFLVHDVIQVPDELVTFDRSGYSLEVEGVVTAINAAVKGGSCLIEAHNHGGQMPRFSWTDRKGLEEFPQYVHSSLPDRPYAATVWGDESIYGEFFLPSGRKGRIRSVAVVGNRFRQVVSQDDDFHPIEPVFDRQLAWFTAQGQRELSRLRIGIVGCGGTGSHIVQNLAYLGGRDFVLVDNDIADVTSMNRLVTATAADIDTHKVILARRLIKSVAPSAYVRSLTMPLQSAQALTVLKGVDLLFGCVDNDGARLILNEMALAYSIPYFDLATGINPQDGRLSSIGGRVAVVLPGGPCLSCMNEIDLNEARFTLASPQLQANEIALGYVNGFDIPSPSVVSLNSVIASIAANELAVFLSGIRTVNVYTEYDLLGTGRLHKGQYAVPTIPTRDKACVACALAGRGDEMGLQRYIADAS